VSQIRSTALLPGRWNRILHGGELFLIPRLQRFLFHGLPIEARFRSYQLFSRGTLLLACSSLSEQAALLLIESGADVNAHDSAGFAPLHEAVWKGNQALVERLLDCGAEIDVKNQWGVSPLGIAVSREIRGLAGEKRLVGLLLERGADMGTVSNTSWEKLWEKLWGKDEPCARSDGMSGMARVAGEMQDDGKLRDEVREWGSGGGRSGGIVAWERR
jgi:hypothetical protein